MGKVAEGRDWSNHEMATCLEPGCSWVYVAPPELLDAQIEAHRAEHHPKPTELFIAPDATGELYVWGPHPTRPGLPIVLGGLPREGLFREWLLDNLPTIATHWDGVHDGARGPWSVAQ